MRHVSFAYVMPLVALAATAACSPGAASPTRAPVVTTSTSVAATLTKPAPATGTPLLAATPIPDPTATDTPGIPTTTPAPPTPAIPAGLYVTRLDIVPDPPVRGANLLFYPTFANTTSGVQNFRWIVYVYQPGDYSKSIGETTATTSSLQLGALTLESLGYWRLALGGPCQDFAARVALLDQNNRPSFFLRADGEVFEIAFSVCAPGDLPQVTATLTGAPTATRTPAPGVFVADLQTDPNPPSRGSDLKFDVSFSNTAATAQDYRWLVYIYRPDDPKQAIGQTTALVSDLKAGSSQVRSLGSWKLPLGGPCEDYIARAEWLDQNNQANIFNRPDGSPFEKMITICPP